MCSVQEEDNTGPLKRSKGDNSCGRKCMKCKEEEAVLITRVNDAFCRACFQVYVTHKFRATIGKTKLVRDGELVLVALSGGPSSSALLHLIQEGLSERAHKKLRFKPGLVHIDEGITVGLSEEERHQQHEKVLGIMQKSGFPFYVCNIEEALELECSRNDQGSGQASDVGSGGLTHTCDSKLDGKPGNGEEAELRLKSLLTSVKSVTEREDLIRYLRHKLLLDVAKQHGYSKVMLGNCGTRLAIRLLTDMATGRGAHASMDTTFADRRNKDIMFLRPLRDFSSKEIAMYNVLHNVEPMTIPTLTTKGNVNVSIEHLTESFVTGLQTEYPSTVSNIMRTGEKLDSSVSASQEEHCVMCQGPLDTDVGASSALGAVEFSQTVSRKLVEKGNNCVKSNECCGEGDGSCQSTNTSVSVDQIKTGLCYGCRLLLHNMDDVSKLPDYLVKEASWRNRRSQMKADIEDYLLDSS